MMMCMFVCLSVAVARQSSVVVSCSSCSRVAADGAAEEGGR